MAKFHFNRDTGNSGKCRATTADGCPFDPENKGENHYDTLEEAQVAAEQKMKEQHGEVYKGFRKGERAGGDLSVHMKRRIINEAAEGVPGADPAVIGRFLSQDKDENIRRNVAEKLNSQKLLRDMSDDESARVRKAVAQRTNNREVLAKLASDPDPKVRYAAIQNEKTPAKARKAAQAAIKEANLKNLEKARDKGNGAAGAPAEAAKTSETKTHRVRKLNEAVRSANRKLNDFYSKNRYPSRSDPELKQLNKEYTEAQDAATRERYEIPESWKAKESYGGGVSYRSPNGPMGPNGSRMEITPNKPTNYNAHDGEDQERTGLYVQTSAGVHMGGPFKSPEEAESMILNYKGRSSPGSIGWS